MAESGIYVYVSHQGSRQISVLRMIAVTGDPLRNNAYVFAQNGFLGYPTGKKIELPRNWPY